MAKKAAVVLLILMLLAGGVAHAGDYPESIMSGDHKAMLIGQIIELGKDTMKIKPLTVMMGEAGPGEITVNRFESYSFDPNYPRKGDYLVALLLDDGNVDETWVFECTSADYKTLEIVCWKYDIVKRYQKYINEGAYFEAQKRLELSISPSATASPLPESSQSPVSSSAPEPTQMTTQPTETQGGLTVAAAGSGDESQSGFLPDQTLIALGAVGVVLVMGIILILLRAIRRKPVSQ